MSTVQKVNFEPTSDLNTIVRRDFPLADPTLADPTNAFALVDGEWMTLDNVAKLKRATDVTTVGAAAAQLAFPLWAERGRYDVQAMSEKKMPILFMGQYEFDTRIYSAAAGIGGSGNAAINAVMQPLRVITITLGNRNYSGLVGSTFASNAPVVGYVSRLPTANGGRLRFISGWAVQNGAT